jgi:hypothetical protein
MANSTDTEIAAEIVADLTRDEEIRSLPRVVADKAAKYAKSIAPVGGTVSEDPHPGAFRDSIGSRDIPEVHGMPAAQVYSDLEAALYIEYGTSRTPEHATFAKTADHFKNVEGVELGVGADRFLEGLPAGIDTSGAGWSVLQE